MEKNFLDHLEDLRYSIIRVLLCLAVLFPLSIFFAQDILEILIKVSCPPKFEFKFFSPMEPLLVQLKIAFTVSIFVAFPYMVYEAWRFIAPGLYAHERRFALLLVGSSWILFIVGIAFSFFLIIPMIMQFSISMGSANLQPAIGLQNFISLTSFMLLGFGLMFQFPIAIYLLVKTGIIELSLLKKQRSTIMIIILVLSAILTPTPDIMTMLIMALPTYLLFEISLFLTGFSTQRSETETKKQLLDNIELSPPDSSSTRKKRQRKIHSLRRK